MPIATTWEQRIVASEELATASTIESLDSQQDERADEPCAEEVRRRLEGINRL